MSRASILGLAAVLVSCARAQAPPGPEPMQPAEQQALLQLAREALRQYFRDGRELQPGDLPASLRRFDRRITFLTFHLEGDTRGCHSAARSDVGTNVVRATLRTLHDDRYTLKDVKGPDGKPVTLRPEEVDRVRLEVNVLRPFEQLSVDDPDSLRGEVEPGIHGVRIAKARNGAYYLPYVGIEFEYDIVPFMRTLAHKAKLKPTEWQKGARLWRFETENFIEEAPGGRARGLFRWNVLAGEVTASALDQAMEKAKAFARGLGARSGYHPKKKEYLGAASAALAARAAAALAQPVKDSRDAASLSWGLLAAIARGARDEASRLADLAASLPRDGRLPPELRARGMPWQREHEEPLLLVRALAAANQLPVARSVFERAQADHRAQVYALADLALAAMALHRADPGGGWLEKARAFAARLREHRFSRERAPRPDYRGALNLDRIPASRDAARAAQAFAALAALGDASFREPALDAAWFVLNLQYREDNAFAYPHLDRYLGGIRADLHHVSVHLEETLEALDAWHAVRSLP